MTNEERAVAKSAVNKYRMDKVRSHITEESKEKARLSNIGKKRSEESKEKMRQAALGRKHSEETKEKLRQANLGKKNPLAKNATSFKAGSEHPNWKGEHVGYRDLHLWIERQLGKPNTCVECGRTNLTGHSIHWANLSGEYKRDISDWKRMCAKCHKKYDRNPITS